MGKYLVQYGIPLLILLPLVWWLVRSWYVKRYGKVVDDQLELRGKHREYTDKLKEEKSE